MLSFVEPASLAKRLAVWVSMAKKLFRQICGLVLKLLIVCAVNRDAGQHAGYSGAYDEVSGWKITANIGA